jgi:sec-independent protein translocase protein TatA
MFGIGTSELIIIFAVILLLFGGKRLPSLATGLGEAIKNFKLAIRENEPSSSSNQLTTKHTDNKNIS